jgi:hypothetical protein
MTARYYLVTPARRGRTGFRSRTHLALKQGRKKLPQSLCKAENNTPEMEVPLVRRKDDWGHAEPPFTLAELHEVFLGTKALCKNCVSMAKRATND